jgi:1-acyl-sn-glycerol-3-phosphate acyltransferase
MAFRCPSGGVAQRGVLDTMVRLAESAYGEEISARVEAVRCGENEAGFDRFGFDPETARYVLAVVTFMHRTYFRTQVFGLENVPPGRSLLISNHFGMVPIDGVLIAAALLLDGNPPRLPRGMVEKWTQQLPYVSMLFARVGQVLGSPDNARRLLEAGPSADGVSGRSPRHRQSPTRAAISGRLRSGLHAPRARDQEPGRAHRGDRCGGAVSQLRQRRAPGARLGLPMFPLLPQALLGFALPLPTRYRIYFGEPLHFEGDADDDDAEIEAHVELVRSTVQNMVTRGVGERKHVFW